MVPLSHGLVLHSHLSLSVCGGETGLSTLSHSASGRRKDRKNRKSVFGMDPGRSGSSPKEAVPGKGTYGRAFPFDPDT